MARYNEKQVNEINLVISNIDKAVKKNGKKKYEIGSRDKTILLSLLRANKIETNRLFFPCKREYSEVIVSHFTNEKGFTRNKFSVNSQDHVYLLF